MLLRRLAGWKRVSRNSETRRRLRRTRKSICAGLERLEDRVVLSADRVADTSLAGASANADSDFLVGSVRGVTIVDGQPVYVDLMLALDSADDPEQIGRESLAELGAVPLVEQEFATNGLVWDVFSDLSLTNNFVTQYYNPANDPTGGKGLAALLATHETWTEVPTSDFTLTFGGTTSRLPSLVAESPGAQYFDGYNDVAWMALDNSKTLAVTWSSPVIDEADIAINTRFNWYTDGVRNYDVETVLLHENGHLAGLSHSSSSESVMRASYASVRRDLAPDDIEGISFLYPAKTVDAPPTVTITGPTDDATISGLVAVAASASDDKQVTRVQFAVDGVPLVSDSSAPFLFNWDTTKFSDGVHTIRATAFDSAGQTASHTITVTVDNAPATPDPAPTDPPPTESSGGMYVWNIGWTEAPRGQDTEIRANVNIRRDSDRDNKAESSDSVVGSTEVLLLVIHDTDGDGKFERGIDKTWKVKAPTKSDGTASLKISKAPAGNYHAEVLTLTHATLTWDPTLDVDNPDNYYSVPGGHELGVGSNVGGGLSVDLTSLLGSLGDIPAEGASSDDDDSILVEFDDADPEVDSAPPSGEEDGADADHLGDERESSSTAAADDLFADIVNLGELLSLYR